MIKKALLSLLVAGILAPSSLRAQTPEEKEYPTDLLAALDSLTVLLNQNCTKSKAGLCFDPEADAESPVQLKLNAKEIQQRLNMLESGIPLDYNKHVEAFVRLYGEKKRELTRRILTLSEYYFPMFEEVLDREGLPLEFKYLAVIESALNPQAQSWAGACGLWQFIHSTGVAYKLKINSTVDERRDPLKATLAACQYFKNSYELYGDWLLVIASYNCGPGNVNKAIRKSGGKRNFWQIMPYLPKETRGYVPAFIAVAYVMNYAQEIGLQPADFDVHSITENVEVDRRVHFTQLNKVLGIPMEDLEYLNPEYRKKVVPATTEDVHVLTLPYRYAMLFTELKDSVYAYPVDDYVLAESDGKRIVHRIRRGESLASIARKYGVTTHDLKTWNIIRGNRVRPGKTLVVYSQKHKSKPKKEKEVKQEEVVVAKTNAIDSLSDVASIDTVKVPVVKTKVQETKVQPKKKVTVRYHKVVSGDTLYSISKKYGVTIQKLRTDNHLSKNAVIKPGTKLKVSKGG